MPTRSPHVTTAIVISLLLLTACGDDGGSATPTTATTTTSAVTTSAPEASTTTARAPSTTDAPATPVTIGAGESCASGSSPGNVDAERGLYAVWVTAIDVEQRTLGVDVIQWLTGDEADDAYHLDNPDDPGGVPNDYYIVNQSTQVRTFDVAGDVDVRVLSSTGAVLTDSTFESLPTAFAARAPVGNAGRLSYSPFWVAVNGGAITGICEQYTP